MEGMCGATNSCPPCLTSIEAMRYSQIRGNGGVFALQAEANRARIEKKRSSQVWKVSCRKCEITLSGSHAFCDTIIAKGYLCPNCEKRPRVAPEVIV